VILFFPLDGAALFLPLLLPLDSDALSRFLSFNDDLLPLDSDAHLFLNESASKDYPEAEMTTESKFASLIFDAMTMRMGIAVLSTATGFMADKEDETASMVHRRLRGSEPGLRPFRRIYTHTTWLILRIPTSWANFADS
jgi:hypothetical protein